jgi:hypothetical protein
MLDTLMALWNRGYGGRGILVSIAFFIICISISLLLVTVEGSWLSWLHQPQRLDNTHAIGSVASPTATSQTSGIQPVPSNTVTIYSPTVTVTVTATATKGPCLVQHYVPGNTPTALANTTRNNSGNGNKGGNRNNPNKPVVPPILTKPKPKPVTPTPQPPPVNQTTPTVGITPASSPPPTVTVTATPGSTPTPSLSSTGTPTNNPAPTPTIATTPVVTPSATNTSTPTVDVSPTASATGVSLFKGNRSSTTASGGPLPGQNTPNTATGSNSSCSNSSTGDSVGINADTSMLAILERNLWLILGGSIFGTILFYISAYVFMRKRGQSA